MPDNNRFSLDDDVAPESQDLLSDVATVTRQAKDRMEADKARDAQLAVAGKNRAVMYSIVVLATLLLIFIAWRVNFRGDGGPESSGSQSGFQRMQGANQPASPPPYPQQPRQGGYAPSNPAAPPSEPVRRNPADSYDEGADEGM